MENNTQREFPEEANMKEFRENPWKACEWMQRKYIGCTEKERKRPESYDWKAGENQKIVEEIVTNPFTHEQRTIKVLQEIPTEELIEQKIKELRLKLILWTITDEEREMLKLLIW